MDPEGWGMLSLSVQRRFCRGGAHSERFPVAWLLSCGWAPHGLVLPPPAHYGSSLEESSLFQMGFRIRRLSWAFQSRSLWHQLQKSLCQLAERAEQLVPTTSLTTLAG